MKENINNVIHLIDRLVEGNEDMISSTEEDHTVIALQRQRDELNNLKSIVEEIKDGRAEMED